MESRSQRDESSRGWSPRPGAIAAAGLVLLGGFLLLFARGRAAAAAPPQPIAFSHRVHYQRGIPCAFCHQDAGRSTFAGLPSVQQCMGCHRVIIPWYPEVQKLHAFWTAQEEIPWRRVTWVPDYVRFSHEPHIQAGVACQTCHGGIGDMDRVRLQTHFQMNTCITCHRAMNAPTDCFQACHH